MKTKNSIILAASICGLFLTVSSGFSQGSLTPPGPPAPTMKTLTQIEPRTPICSGNYTITNPGSYYLTTNIFITSGDGIDVDTNGVTIDLNGFTITGINNAYEGIGLGSAPYCFDLTVLNGHINGNYVYNNGSYTGNGFNTGIGYNGNGNVRISGVTVTGVSAYGIALGSGISTIVESCAVNTSGGYGIVAGNISHSTANQCKNGFWLNSSGGNISHCVAVNNSNGIVASAGCVVADCTASGNSSDGINVGDGTLVRSCASYQNGNNGFTTSSNCTVIGCTAGGNNEGNNFQGIHVGDNCTIKDCTASGNYVLGIYVGENGTVIGCTAGDNIDSGIDVGDNCTIKDCTASGNTYGIDVEGDNCQVVGNTCSGNNGDGIFLGYGGGKQRVDNNVAAHNDEYGINANNANAGNSITRNFAPGNGVSGYNITAGNNDFAPIQAPSTSTNPWANF